MQTKSWVLKAGFVNGQGVGSGVPYGCAAAQPAVIGCRVAFLEFSGLLCTGRLTWTTCNGFSSFKACASVILTCQFTNMFKGVILYWENDCFLYQIFLFVTLKETLKEQMIIFIEILYIFLNNDIIFVQVYYNIPDMLFKHTFKLLQNFKIIQWKSELHELTYSDLIWVLLKGNWSWLQM